MEIGSCPQIAVAFFCPLLNLVSPLPLKVGGV